MGHQLPHSIPVKTTLNRTRYVVVFAVTLGKLGRCHAHEAGNTQQLDFLAHGPSPGGTSRYSGLPQSVPPPTRAIPPLGAQPSVERCPPFTCLTRRLLDDSKQYNAER